MRNVWHHSFGKIQERREKKKEKNVKEKICYFVSVCILLIFFFIKQNGKK